MAINNKERGSTWILLRGLAREQAHWGSFLELFAARFPEDEVLALDLPGIGEHGDEMSPLTITAMFNHVRGEAVMRARGQGQFKLFAVSLGGMVAMEWMRLKPEDLAACVLVNSSSRRLSPFYQRMRWQVWKEFIRLVSTANVRERERGILDLLMNNPEARAEALPLWVKIANERPVTYMAFLAQLTAAATFKGLTQAPAVPTLLLSSLGDRLVDPSCSTRLHQSFQWPISRHPWAGHDLTWDDPQWTLQQLQKWTQTTVFHAPSPAASSL